MYAQLLHKARRRFRGYPLATVAYYGPDNLRASKVVVAISGWHDSGAAVASWSVERGDVRRNGRVNRLLLDFVDRHRVQSVVITAGVVGCPHEDGLGRSDDGDARGCSLCPYWAVRKPRGRSVGQGVAS